MEPEKILLGMVWYAVFLLSTTCHEAAHAWVAKLGGDLTAFHEGQVSLSPLPHIRREPFGTVLVPLLSYLLGGWMIGWASAPYDPVWAERHPRRAALMALAGPLANLTLVLLAAIGIRVGLAAGEFVAPARIDFTSVAAAAQPGLGSALATLLSILFVLNLLLFLFNLLPVPPLDGSSAVTLLMSEETGRRFREFTHSWGFIGLLLAWYLFRQIFDPLFVLSLNVLYFPLASYG